MSMLGIQVDVEGSEVYPECVCNSCYITLNKTEEKGGAHICPKVRSWYPHTEQCQLCLDASAMSIGGRPRKRQLVGRPANDDIYSVRKIIHKLNCVEIPQNADEPLEKSISQPWMI